MESCPCMLMKLKFLTKGSIKVKQSAFIKVSLLIALSLYCVLFVFINIQALSDHLGCCCVHTYLQVQAGRITCQVRLGQKYCTG